jgi:hypothetical protein
VDFDDLVEKTSELTGRGIPLGGKFRTKFDTLLVDEFQDTDRLQSDILKALAGNPFDTGQLFVVGDVKQAIYRFRGADPDALLRLRDEMREEGQLNLMRNYRSCKQSASRGIGRAIALQLSRCGATVGCVSTNKEKLEAGTVAEIRAAAAVSVIVTGMLLNPPRFGPMCLRP